MVAAAVGVEMMLGTALWHANGVSSKSIWYLVLISSMIIGVMNNISHKNT